MNAKVKVAEAQFGEMQARMQRLDVRAPAAGLVLACQSHPVTAEVSLEFQ